MHHGWGIGKRLLQHERSGMTILVGGSVKQPVAKENPYIVLIRRYGADAALVGEALMRAGSPEETLRAWRRELGDG